MPIAPANARPARHAGSSSWITYSLARQLVTEHQQLYPIYRSERLLPTLRGHYYEVAANKMTLPVNYSFVFVERLTGLVEKQKHLFNNQICDC